MAYAQWVIITIKNKSRSKSIKIKNVELFWGKFHKRNNKDAEIPKSEIEGHEIKHGDEYVIYSCGRSDSASGTNGALDIYDGDSKICKLYWDSPWGTSANQFIVSEKNDDWGVEVNPNFNTSGTGPLGEGTVSFFGVA